MTDAANPATQGSTPASAAATTSPPAGTAAGATPASASPKHDFQSMSLEQFNARIAEAESAGARKVLKDLGVEKADDAKARLQKASALEQEKLSDVEKRDAKIKELEPLAQRAATYEASIKRAVETREKAIPEAKRGLLELAPADPHARLEWLEAAHAKGLFAEAAAAPTKDPATAEKRDPKPATTLAPPGPKVEKPPGTLTAYEQLQDLRNRGLTVRAAAFAKQHAKAIEASRPK